MKNPRSISFVSRALGVTIAPLSVLVGALVLVGGASCSKSEAAAHPATPEPPPGQVWLTPAEVRDAHIAVQKVGLQDVDDAIVTTGTVTLEDQLTGHVFSPVSGRVVNILHGVGDRVKKGDPLAVIDSPDIGSAVSDVHKAQAGLIAAEHDLKRKRELVEQKAASQADVEGAEDAYRTAKAEMQRARQKQYLFHVGNVDAVTQMYTLTSPVDGEVLVRNINPGIEVQGQYAGGSGIELFTVGEIDKMWVLGDVYEVDLGRIHLGAAAVISVLAYPDRVFKGQVDWISGSLDPNTRTAKVRCSFDNPDRLLRPQMYATLRVSVDQRMALAVPTTSILRLGEYNVVFVELAESPDRVSFERLPIDIDEREGSPWLEVKHGLEAGQNVVVQGAAVLSQKL